MFRPITGLLCALALTGGPAFAEPTLYTCMVQVPRTNSWIPPQIVIAQDVETGKILVNDPLIQYFVGQPLEAEILEDTEKRITFAWTLKDAKDSEGTKITNFRYRATLIKATGLLTVSAKPLNFNNTFSGRGRCVVE